MLNPSDLSAVEKVRLNKLREDQLFRSLLAKWLDSLVAMPRYRPGVKTPLEVQKADWIYYSGRRSLGDDLLIWFLPAEDSDDD